ncbi:MAG: peptidoglycan DD-metalloendopeptidase family protein [Spirochaetales bacterium]|nr:peptidoglycan DD-metalloendopeptidase family protein [Spirochaetales bacterium]
MENYKLKLLGTALLLLMTAGLPADDKAPVFDREADVISLCGFGPQQNAKGEWYLSKGVVLEFRETEKIFSPQDGVVIAVESEKTFPPDFFMEQPVNMVVIQFEDSTAMVVYNLKTVLLEPGEKISRGRTIGITGNGRDNRIQITFIKSDAPLGEFEINGLIYPGIDSKYQQKYKMEYLDPFDIIEPGTMNVLLERK